MSSMKEKKASVFFSFRWRCAPLFHGGDRPLQLLVSVLTRNALYGSWFNRPPGICPCPLYTPPVALTDGPLCEFEGLAFLLWKLKRTVWSKGKRSRNKASVGEPADGSLRCFSLYFKLTHTFLLVSHLGVTRMYMGLFLPFEQQW